jgi:enterobactin synthetase component D
MKRAISVARLRFDASLLLALAGEVPLPDIVRIAAPKRRADFIAGRLAARAAIKELTGQMTLVGQAEGRPVWPDGTTGSISHSGGCAIAVASSTTDYRALGVDVETQLTEAQAETLAPQILTVGEKDRLRGSVYALNSFAKITTIVFSLKECLFKALNPQTDVLFYHEDAEVLALSPNGLATIRLLKSIGHQWPQGTVFNGHFVVRDDQVFALVTMK